LLLSIFAAIILLGSVHLGWHYALDSYAAIIGAWLVWVGFGWTINRCPSIFGQKLSK
jgi:divalent metal cation (Fe/Co/Zn/Cd) transporter